MTRLTRQNRGSFSFGNLLVDPLMGPCPIEIRNIGTQNTMQQLFIEDQHVVKALSPHTAQETFTDGIGSWGVIGRFKHLNTTCCCNSSEIGTKLPIMITDEILRRVSIR